MDAEVRPARVIETAFPKYAHIPLILNPEGSKMSKRDTGASLTTYMDGGYETAQTAPRVGPLKIVARFISANSALTKKPIAIRAPAITATCAKPPNGRSCKRAGCFRLSRSNTFICKNR